MDLKSIADDASTRERVGIMRVIQFQEKNRISSEVIDRYIPLRRNK